MVYQYRLELNLLKILLIFLKIQNILSTLKPYIVHRLDKETSGVMIVAKNREYAQLFTSLFRIRKIHKTYLAITHGELKKILIYLKTILQFMKIIKISTKSYFTFKNIKK